MNETIKLALQGNGDALREIYSQYKKPVYYFCLKLMVTPEDAAEMTAETFDCAFARLETLEDVEQLDIWLKNIAAIRCYNYIHKMKPMLFLQAVADTEELLFSEQEIEDMPRGSIEETQTCAFMDKMINRLNDAQRMTLMFHYYNGLSLVQIAKIMGCTVEIVKQRMGKAADHMRNTISALNEQGIQLKKVDFRTALRLMAACVNVPQIADAQVEGVIISISSNEEEPPKPEVDYNFENFAPKTELPVVDDTASEIKSEEVVLTPIKVKEKPQRKAAERPANVILQKIKGLSVMQQSVALLVVVAIIAGIVIGIGRGSKKENPDTAASAVKRTESTVSQAPVKPEEDEVAEEKPQYKMVVETQKEEIKAEDGTVVARVTFQYPNVTLGEANVVAETEINKFFEEDTSDEEFDKKKIIDEFVSLKDHYILGYTNPSYGEWKINETKITLKEGLLDENVLSFALNKEKQAYGYPNNTHAAEAYTFSVKSGERLELADIFAAETEFRDFASLNIKTQLEKNQEAGKYGLTYNYPQNVDNLFTANNGWYLTQEGITFVIDPGEVADYIYGVQTFSFTYAEINQYLKPEFKK